jgi:hypothetical protein
LSTLKLTSSIEILQSLGNTSGHSLLSFSNPDAGIKVLLVWLVLSIRVSDLLHEVILLVENVISNTSKIGVLEIGIKVDLDDTVGNGIKEFLLRRSRSTVEDQEHWLIFLSSNSVLHKLLVLAKELWVKLNISWFINTVHVTKTSGNGEVWGDWLKSLVDSENVLGLGVERVVVDILIVDTVFFATSDTNFLGELERSFPRIDMETYHLEPLLHWGSALEVFSSSLDVKVNLLLAQIDHVAGE